MATVDQRMLEALRRALKFEDDGIAYYQKAMNDAASPLTVDVLTTLRDEEVKHKRRINRIYEEVSQGGRWLEQEPAEPMPSFVNIFERMGGKPTERAKGSEIEALEHALDIEANGRGMYRELADGAPSEPERAFYERLLHEEEDHIALIEDSLSYFQDPDGWFRSREHHVLDGA
jgi:rubrerythrin